MTHITTTGRCCKSGHANPTSFPADTSTHIPRLLRQQPSGRTIPPLPHSPITNSYPTIGPLRPLPSRGRYPPHPKTIKKEIPLALVNNKVCQGQVTEKYDTLLSPVIESLRSQVRQRHWKPTPGNFGRPQSHPGRPSALDYQHGSARDGK